VTGVVDCLSIYLVGEKGVGNMSFICKSLRS